VRGFGNFRVIHIVIPAWGLLTWMLFQTPVRYQHVNQMVKVFPHCDTIRQPLHQPASDAGADANPTVTAGTSSQGKVNRQALCCHVEGARRSRITSRECVPDSPKPDRCQGNDNQQEALFNRSQLHVHAQLPTREQYSAQGRYPWIAIAIQAAGRSDQPSR